MKKIDLKYGLNPNQKPASLEAGVTGELPLEVINGAPGYINLMDAVRGWQLVRELKAATGRAAAASMKHVNPAGAGIDLPPRPGEYFFEGGNPAGLSGGALAYLRARSGDPVASFGDFAALSEEVDEPLALLLKGLVSDGIVAPSFRPEALKILKEKKKGAFLILKMDPAFGPKDPEERDLFGMNLVQEREKDLVSKDDFKNVVTGKPGLSEDTLLSLVVTSVAVKHAQSNTVGVGAHGQLAGLGCGQQSRIHCTRLACARAEKWALRQAAKVKGIPFAAGLSPVERNNLADQYLEWDSLSDFEKRAFEKQMAAPVEPLSEKDRRDSLGAMGEAVLVSDAFIPFRDNVDRAGKSGIRVIAQTGGSLRDQEVTDAARELGITMIHTGKRLFLH